MKYSFNHCIGLLAVLALILGSWIHGEAQARPRMHELRAMVICGETGAETVLLDARGLPVQPQDCAQGLCPDCLPGAALAVAATAPLNAPTLARRVDAPVPAFAAVFGHDHPAMLPRGPPAQH